MSRAASFPSALNTFRRQGGVFRAIEARGLGVPSTVLTALERSGRIQRIARGVYQLADRPPLSDPDLVTVALKVPNGVICLISALAFHELTEEVPHAVDIAVLRGTEPPRLATPPVRSYQISEPAFSAGTEKHLIDGVSVRIYGPEKTIADCFKFRNKIGLEVALDALKRWSTRRGASSAMLLEYARICRVDRVMRPYLEAIL